MKPGNYGLIGPNAAGKTHYLRSRFTHGAAFVPAAADAHFAGRTVADHLRAAHAVRPLNDDLLADFNPGAKIRDLSVGQRRLLTICTALAAEEDLLLLDEPFDGLDVDNRARIRELLIDTYTPERTMIIASHRSDDLAGLVDSVITVFDQEVSEPISLDKVRRNFPTLLGRKDEVRQLVEKRKVVREDVLGPTVRVTFAEPLDHPSATYPSDQELIDLLASGKANR
ncbi:ABC transporter ATP-binding protein [Corynebacterium breve]|uniref:ABC transporter ATP-binding protein n=1 Tax=Corynebacterium breve TaxID=3049799 RepID=A0ABY8VEV9_9CORY|nr:ABC transporter ATP-binding protein [Corynebacterium breve]WIM68201.1 ABC transporter ATP-binding protein [Corynebacterium breve]